MKKYSVSFFKQPITGACKYPRLTVSLFWVWLTVTMKWLQHGNAPDRDISIGTKTEQLRAIMDDKLQRNFKSRNFDFITPAGQFSYFNDQSLVEYSGCMCMDLDHLDDGTPKMKRRVSPEEMKRLLLADPYLGPRTLLMFTSPRQHGVKPFFEIDLTQCEYATWFQAIRNYLMATYGLGDEQVDPHVGNLSRACFLSYDPDAYLRADLFENFNY